MSVQELNEHISGLLSLLKAVKPAAHAMIDVLKDTGPGDATGSHATVDVLHNTGSGSHGLPGLHGLHSAFHATFSEASKKAIKEINDHAEQANKAVKDATDAGLDAITSMFDVRDNGLTQLLKFLETRQFQDTSGMAVLQELLAAIASLHRATQKGDAYSMVKLNQEILNLVSWINTYLIGNDPRFGNLDPNRVISKFKPPTSNSGTSNGMNP